MVALLLAGPFLVFFSGLFNSMSGPPSGYIDLPSGEPVKIPVPFSKFKTDILLGANNKDFLPINFFLDLFSGEASGLTLVKIDEGLSILILANSGSSVKFLGMILSGSVPGLTSLPRLRSRSRFIFTEFIETKSIIPD